jgi:gamma-glutamyltranspeptidase/glutathione hydrolase
MFYSQNFGLLAILSMILFVAWLPSASTSPLEFSIRDTDHDNGQEREVGPGKLGAVATENAICSRHGIEMFEMGGNAADAVSTPCLERDIPEKLECKPRANQT